MLHYFAYGSNLHPVRLTERVPSASLVGTVALRHHDLVFHKQSHDGSGKCNLFRTGAASDVVHGAIYRLEPLDKPVLDRCEGKGNGYIDEQITLTHDGRAYTCFTYIAQHSHIVDSLKPYHWYKKLVLLGASYLQFPHTYISAIESIRSIADPDAERSQAHDVLLEKILNYQD
jgi:gamma-glutamylcyclotransferase